MESVLEIAGSFPVAIFTTINLVIIGVWLLMALGLFDVEFFDLDIDFDGDVGDVSGVAGFLVTLGLTGVPIFIVLTIIFFCSWLISYFAVKYGLFWNNSDAIRYLIGAGILVVSFLMSIPITAQIIKPLRKLFTKLNSSTTSQSLLGKQCKVRTTKVTSDFGEAECLNDGASLILKVRSDEKYHLVKGDLARVISVEVESSIYQVVPEKEFESNKF
ncbi:OB-fold-containig protein [Aliikangiella sp. G2MR2-5]|uniref:OB-fold-containig protein n=1 Tax=Aliikangiella sp. G2MR2-5 TaxID=2788943 RepID=UPI0018ABFAF4|nr:OB-fold-containig protein [Aliikangiella sp. G2MR2-5]